MPRKLAISKHSMPWKLMRKIPRLLTRNVSSTKNKAYNGEKIFSSRLNFSCLGFLDFSSLLFCRVLRRIYKSLLNKKNYWILHRRGIEPSIIVTVAQSVTSRPPMLADIGIRLNVSNKLWGRLPIVINWHFWSRKSIQGKTEARKVKPGEKCHSCFVFFRKTEEIRF